MRWSGFSQKTYTEIYIRIFEIIVKHNPFNSNMTKKFQNYTCFCFYNMLNNVWKITYISGTQYGGGLYNNPLLTGGYLGWKISKFIISKYSQNF